LAIVGASGVGKSTLLHILGTLDRPTSGKVLYGAEDVFQLPTGTGRSFGNRRIGFVFPIPHLLPEFNALENSMMPGLIAGLPKKEIKEKALALLLRLDWKGVCATRPGNCRR